MVLPLLVFISACRAEEEAPVGVAKAYAKAVQRRDVKGVIALVDEAAVQHLEEAAERASDQIGGRRNVEAHEMLQIVDIDPDFQMAGAELVSGSEDAATVKLLGADGQEHVLELVRQDEQWRVRVPRPASEQGTP